jgi:multidrug resistance efflux pump
VVAKHKELNPDESKIAIIGGQVCQTKVRSLKRLRLDSFATLATLVYGLAMPQTAFAQGANPHVMTLGAARSGIVRSILVENGAHVEAGQVLVRLDCGPLEKEINFRTASLAAFEASLARVRNGPRPEEIAIAEAGLGVAIARAEEAHDALQRANGLQPGVTVTRAQLFVVERDARIADAQQLDAAKKLALLKAGSRVEDINEAQARRDAALAFLEEGNAEFDQCTIRAPASGTIQLEVTTGQIVSIYFPTPVAHLTADGPPK